MLVNPNLEDYIHGDINIEQFLVRVFVDLQRGFDTGSHEILLQ